MSHPARLATVTIFVTALAVSSVLHAQSASENAADAERLVKVLDIHTGSIVGEIGAGGGELTIALAKVVGESGRVLTNELNAKSLAKIGTAAADAGVRNVTLVEGHDNDTNLPATCCDAIFMRSVYHHFGDPPQMNASLLASLKPGGRLAVIDFTPPPGGENPPGRRGLDNHHGVTPATVERELKQVGFEIVSSTDVGSRGFMVVARKPG